MPNKNIQRLFSFKNHKFVLSVCWVFFILSFVPGCILLRLGFDFVDIPYQIMNAMDWRNAPMSPLSALLGNIFGNIFGWEQLKFRILAFILTQGSICIGSLWLYRHRHSAIEALIVGGSAIFMNGLFSYTCWHYGWDSWSYFSIVICTLIFLSYIDNPSYAKLIALAFATACCILTRLPNLVIVPILMLGVLLTKRDAKVSRLCAMDVYLVASAAFLYILIVCMYGSAGCFLESLRSNYISEHGFRFLINLYLEFSRPFIDLFLIIWAFWLVYRLLYNKRRMWVTGLVIIILSFVAMYMYYEQSTFGLMGRVNETLLLLLILGAIFRHRNDIRICAVLIVIAALSFVSLIGSNMDLIKGMGMMFVPICWAFYSPVRQKVARGFVVIVLLTGLFVGYYERHYTTWYTPPIQKATSTARGNLFAGLKDTPETNEMIHVLVEKIDSLRENGYHITPVGGIRERFGYEYLLNMRDTRLAHEWESFKSIFTYPKYNEYVKSIADSASIVLMGPRGRYSYFDTLLVKYLDEHMEPIDSFASNWRIYKKRPTPEVISAGDGCECPL